MKKEEILKTFRGIFEKALQYKYIIAVISIGLIMLAIPTGKTRNDAPTIDKQDIETTSFDVNEIEKKFEENFARIDGVGRVKIMLSLKSDGKTFYAEEIRRSSNLSSDESYDESYENAYKVVSDQSGRESLVAIKKETPEFMGAVVICDGADKSPVKLSVISAVSALTGIPSNKISVIKMKD